MTRSFSFALGLTMLVVVLAGCSRSTDAGVFDVKQGMSKREVLKLAGSPYQSGPNCWLYHASKKDTSIVGMRFCFTHGHVSLVQTSVHL